MPEVATGVYSMHNAHFAGLCEELLRGEGEEERGKRREGRGESERGIVLG